MTRRPQRRTSSQADAAAPAPVHAAGAADTAVPPARVTVRHYCQGIGDCHLLKFAKDDGSDFWMLIDCGIQSSITGGTETIANIASDIASATERIDVVVATHEHWDHISGFLTAADRFKKMTFGEVWMAWTENPSDPHARELDKYKEHALAALQMTSRHLDRASGLSQHLSAVRDGLESVLGFHFGAKGEKVRAARDAVAKLAHGAPKYLEPSDPPITLP